MDITSFLLWLQDSPPIAALRSANHLVIEVTGVVHVIGLVLLLTSLLLVNLRLLGVVFREQRAALLATAVAPLLWTGLALTLASGSLLFLSGPLRYVQNVAFIPKAVLLAGALLLQLGLYRYVVRAAEQYPTLARSTAVLSLTLWFGVGFFGRAIGYV